MLDVKKIFRSEFAWILTGEVVLVALILVSQMVQLGPLAVLRAILGLAYVLFVPGYALQVALFPQKTHLDGPERVALSFGLSIAIVALLALLLDRLPWGIQLWSIVVSEGLLLVLFSLVALWRRGRQPLEDRFVPIVRVDWRGFWASQDRTGRILLSVLGVALIMAVGLAISFAVLPSPAELFTEFYILGPEGLAESYPRQGVVGQPLEVTVGITNREGVEAEYIVGAYQGEQLIGEMGPFRLADEENKEATLTFAPVDVGDDVRVNIYLFRDGQPEPYRSLLLWLKIEPAQ
ncbi:MAG: DUF1616 domain-containing protein [Anaerolineales bacterium]|nr:DUF1616 domain-containing protein [Anaerolineales bacterium]